MITGRDDRQNDSQDASAETMARVTESFERQGLMTLLAASLTHISAGRVQITLPRRA